MIRANDAPSRATHRPGAIDHSGIPVCSACLASLLRCLTTGIGIPLAYAWMGPPGALLVISLNDLPLILANTFSIVCYSALIGMKLRYAARDAQQHLASAADGAE